MEEDGRRSWPVRLLRPAGQIRWRIIAPYAALTVALAIAGTFLVTRLVGGSLDERFNNQLAEASRVASDSLVRRERRHLEAVRGISFTDGTGAAASARDGAALARLIEPILANGSIERGEIIAPDGARLYASRLTDATALSYEPLTDDDQPAFWGPVLRVLAGESDARGDKFTAVVSTASGPVLYTAGPLFDGERLAGVVLIGTSMQSVLAGAKAESLADVTVYGDGGAALATTFPPEDERGTLNLTPGKDVLATQGPSLVRERRTLYGRNYDLLYGTLTLRGEPVNEYSVGLPSSFIFNAQATTRMQMTAMFSVAMALTLFMGWMISRSITRPVQQLVRAANAVTAGDLSARSGVTGEHEIGVLGRAFDAMTERLQRQHLATVKALTSAIDARDPYTLGHSLRVGQLAVELGRELGLSPTELQHLEIGGYLHDIGKIGVRDSVLLKPGPLTLEERHAIERHPSIGIDILEHVDLPAQVLEFVAGHHEKLDGSGYPSHAHGDRLSMIPRIAAVADIYDALTTDRPYRGAMAISTAMEILHREARAGQLDARVIAALEAVAPAWEERRRAEPGLRGFRLPGGAARHEEAA